MSKFSIGCYVRKHAGAFWEGFVVGHYSTEQTPDGVAVQLFGWPNGPVQIYPAAALEPYQPSGIEGERCPGFRADMAPENHDALDGDWQKAASGTDYLGFAVEHIVWRGRRATIVDRDLPIGTPVTSAKSCTPPPSSHVAGDALRILQEGIDGAEADMQSDSDAGERVDLFDYEISLPYETAREIAALLKPEPIVCDVLTMQHSSGFPDHFTRVRVGQRELTLLMSKIRGRCEYHAAELNWLLNGAEKPHILDFSDDEPEGLSEYLKSLEAKTSPPQPNVAPDEDTVGTVARRIYEDAHKGMSSIWSWNDRGLDDEHPGTRERYLGYARSAIAATPPPVQHAAALPEKPPYEVLRAVAWMKVDPKSRRFEDTKGENEVIGFERAEEIYRNIRAALAATEGSTDG